MSKSAPFSSPFHFIYMIYDGDGSDGGVKPTASWVSLNLVEICLPRQPLSKLLMIGCFRPTSLEWRAGRPSLSESE